MTDIENLNIREFYAAPRHAHYLASQATSQTVVVARLNELARSGRIAGKKPIINLQSDPDIVELHDGNHSVLPWILYAEQRGLATTLGNLRQSFASIEILHNRLPGDHHRQRHPWHPFLPPEMACANKLQVAHDVEQNRDVCKALDLSNNPVYFNNTEFFNGIDSAASLGQMADMTRLILQIQRQL